MDTSQRRSLSLKLDFMDMFFGISNLPTMSLVPKKKSFIERKRKRESFNTQQMNFFAHEKLENVYNLTPKKWMERLHDTKMNLENYSPSLTLDLAKAIERSMQQINYMKYPNKIIDMLNSEKISSSINNIENLIYSKMNGDISKTKDSVANCSEKNFDQQMTEEKQDIVEWEGNKAGIMTAELEQCSDMEGPPMGKQQVARTWRKIAKIEANRGRGRGKVQLRKSGVSQLKHKKERSKQNLHSNIQEDIDAWAEDPQELLESSTEDADTPPDPIYNQSQSDRTTQNYQSTSADYPTLPQKFPSNLGPKSTNKKPKINYDSPTQATRDYASFSWNCSSRRISDSSVDSEESGSIVFQDDSECDSPDVDSDYESSDDELREQKVRFCLVPEIHVMIQWDYAYRAARRGPWEEIARDRERFRRRINCVDKILKPILSMQHREQVYLNRFDVDE